MKDEIKEILYILNGIVSHKWTRLLPSEADKLLDYITNLQKENKRLKTALEENNNVSIEKYNKLKLEKEGLELRLFTIKDYKSCCEKAIEYINCNKQKTICAYGDNEDDDFEICLWEEDIDNLLNILQNGSDSQ